MAKNTPDFRTVALTDTNAHKLSTLLAAADSQIPVKCSRLGIQFDENAGANALLVGNSGLAGAGTQGRRLLATQAFDLGPFESNLIRTDQVYLQLTGGAPLNVYVFTLTR